MMTEISLRMKDCNMDCDMIGESCPIYRRLHETLDRHYSMHEVLDSENTPERVVVYGGGRDGDALPGHLDVSRKVSARIVGSHACDFTVKTAASPDSSLYRELFNALSEGFSEVSALQPQEPA